MVNDITTLNGSLSQLGETLASNITQKGVQASASDGLTTLANKVLQISGDTPTPTTVLFEDSGVTGTKNNDFVFNSNTNYCQVTTDTDGTVFLYTHSGQGDYIPNIDIHSYTNLEITWTFTYGTRYACQTSLLNSNKDYSSERWHNAGTSTPNATWYTPNGQTTISRTLTVGDTMKLVKENNTFSFYCNDILISSTTPNYDVYYLGFTSADNNRPFGYKDLKIIDTSGGGSDCSQYQTEISNAIEYINGDGT